MFQVPKRSSAGSYLLKALLVIAIVIFLGKRMPLWLARSRSSGYSQIHPIEQLHEQHLDHFVRKLQNQSKTLQAANREYERRNGRVPPEGFDAWFNLAKSHSFVFIDEFDGIMHAIQALWDIPSSILRSRLEYARYERAQGLAFFEVNSGKVDFLGSSGSGDLERALLRRLERISGMGWTLPDVTFFLNTLDEPRVFAHEQDVARSLSNVTTWQSYEPYSATAELQKTCSQSQSSSLSGNTQDYRSLSFTSNTIESADYCRHSDLFQQHGFLQAPETFILTRDIVRVLSSCAAAHFSDIIIPSVLRVASDAGRCFRAQSRSRTSLGTQRGCSLLVRKLDWHACNDRKLANRASAKTCNRSGVKQLRPSQCHPARTW